MKNLVLLLLLLLTLTTRAAPPTVPAAFDALGIHLTLDADAQRLTQAKVNSLCRHSSAFQARVALAAQAFPLLDRVLLAEGVPADFRYLAVQESALRGDAASPHGAVGYWQLKRETARSLGLVVDERVDERQHAAASTRAAARYLARNQAELRNWLNTLLSYYLGPSGVRAAIRSTDPDATEMALTGRSNPYLFDFLAYKIAFEPALSANGLAAEPPANAWREVPAAAGQTLDQQAAALDLDPNALAALNPWLLTSAVPADGRAYTWVVAAPAPATTPTPTASTASTAPTAPTAPTASTAPPQSPFPPASASPAETPAPPVAVKPAPAPNSTPAPADSAPAPPPPAPAKSASSTPARPPVEAVPALASASNSAVTTSHRVGAGETLYSLARQLNVRPADLAALNQLPPNATLRVGQPLLLPAAGPGAPVASSYVVAKGDTFYSISRRFGCPVGVLQAFNVRPGSALRVGEVLRVPARP